MILVTGRLLEAFLGAVEMMKAYILALYILAEEVAFERVKCLRN